MLVKDLYTKTLVTITEEISLKIALSLMLKYKIHSLVVISKNNKVPVGIITKSNIIDAICKTPGALLNPVSSKMSASPFTTFELTTVSEAASIMAKVNITHLIVC